MNMNKRFGVSASLLILPGLLCDSRLFAAQLDRFPHARIVDGFYGGASGIEDMAGYALARADLAKPVAAENLKSFSQ